MGPFSRVQNRIYRIIRARMVRDGAKQGRSQGEQREQCSPFGLKKSENRADFGTEGAVLEIFTITLIAFLHIHF